MSSLLDEYKASSSAPKSLKNTRLGGRRISEEQIFRRSKKKGADHIDILSSLLTTLRQKFVFLNRVRLASVTLRQKSLQYLHIATHFFLVYPKHLLTENCAHPSPKEFLTDFGDARRRKVRTFQGERRQKMRKFIGEGLVGSSPLRLPVCRENSQKTPKNS